ncbi:MAG: type II secretion system GspH family protein [Acidobacteria bacterium]|nr:type II secretion system GspH family protein [Acidobacteriota bacterium]
MKQRGFTLLEVLVATLIMGIAVAGVLAAISTSMRSAARLTDYDRAAMLARSKMDELLLEPALPLYTVVEGPIDPSLMGGARGGWRARMLPFEKPPQVAPGVQVLNRVELEVWWMSGEQRRAFSLEAFRAQVVTPQDLAQ